MISPGRFWGNLIVESYDKSRTFCWSHHVECLYNESRTCQWDTLAVDSSQAKSEYSYWQNFSQRLLLSQVWTFLVNQSCSWIPNLLIDLKLSQRGYLSCRFLTCWRHDLSLQWTYLLSVWNTSPSTLTLTCLPRITYLDLSEYSSKYVSLPRHLTILSCANQILLWWKCYQLDSLSGSSRQCPFLKIPHHVRLVLTHVSTSQFQHHINYIWHLKLFSGKLLEFPSSNICIWC